MAVFLPRRWNRQPVGPVGIHPYWLSRGLRGSILPQPSGVLVDVIRKGLGTGQAFSATPGPALMFPNGLMRPLSTSAISATFPTTWGLGTSNACIIAGIVNNTSNFDHGCIIKVGSATTGFGVGLGPQAGDWDSNAVGAAVIGLYEAVRWVASSGSSPLLVTTVPTFHNIGMIINSAGVPAMILNGVISATQAGTGMVAPAGNTSYVGGYQANRFPLNDNLLYAHIFACAPTAGEVLDLHRNPWQVYTHVTSKSYSLPAAADTSGSVAFAGSGALAAVGKELRAGSVAFAGVGSFAVVGKELGAASVQFAGSGALSAVGKALAKAASALSGSGSFAPVGKTLANGAVAFVGAGALVPVGKESAAASVAFAGGSTFAPVSAQSGAGAVSFVGSASFDARGATLAKVAAAFAGAASFAPVGQEFAKGNVSFAGLGAFAPAGQVSAQGVGAVTFAGLGAFAPVATAIAAGSVAFGGSGGIDVQSTGAAAESSGGRVGPAPPRRIHLVPMIARVHTGQSAQTVRARATLTLVVVSVRTRQAGQGVEAQTTMELDGQVATASAAEIRAFVGMRMLASGKGWQPGQGGRLAANAGMDTKVTSGIFPREPPPTYDGPTFEGLDPRYRNAA